MAEQNKRESESLDDKQQHESRGKSVPSPEMGTHMVDSNRMIGGVPRGGKDSPSDVSNQQYGEASQQDRTIGQD